MQTLCIDPHAGLQEQLPWITVDTMANKQTGKGQEDNNLRNPSYFTFFYLFSGETTCFLSYLGDILVTEISQLFIHLSAALFVSAKALNIVLTNPFQKHTNKTEELRFFYSLTNSLPLLPFPPLAISLFRYFLWTSLLSRDWRSEPVVERCTGQAHRTPLPCHDRRR